MDLRYQNGPKTQKEYIKPQKDPLNIQIPPQHVKFYLKPEPKTKKYPKFYPNSQNIFLKI